MTMATSSSAGRARDVIIRGGANIYPSDVELALQAHPAVEEAAVVGWPSSEYGEEVAAFVIAHGTVTASALIAHCRHNLSRHKVPREVHIVKQLPRNSIGKVLKNDLVRRLRPAVTVRESDRQSEWKRVAFHHSGVDVARPCRLPDC